MNKNIKNIVIVISLWNIMAIFTFVWFTILTCVVAGLSGLMFIDNMKMLYPLFTLLSIVISSITTYKYMISEEIIKPFEIYKYENI
jgi:hypothetical protein